MKNIGPENAEKIRFFGPFVVYNDGASPLLKRIMNFCGFGVALLIKVW